MTVLLTGAAGFIGYHVTRALLARGERVVGVDDCNPYYDVRLKEARLGQLSRSPGFVFHRLDITDREAILALFATEASAQHVVHLAAQAGVRYALVDPYSYSASNVAGHLVILEAARRLGKLRHLVYASSSSVYGANTKLPFAEADPVDHPVSLYAATKRAGELIAYTYAHQFALPLTGLRFFTVYGPWGRPDMAYYSFARAIVERTPITLYDEGRLRRDFTYIDDIVAGVLGCLDRAPETKPPARVLNIGNHRSEEVATLVELLEEALGRRAVIRCAPRPATEVVETFAATEAIASLTGFRPATPLAEGIPRFVAWFRSWHGVG
ncbi:MAG TPA: NAD-dependent epimerase/dehydratase family protein [Acetobacteraceae bacterium]|nr:NAD-dependent epimerase/dehydratase family protein [Acetobacteraceae bacterium]